MTIEPGIYTITNVKSGTALDLSGGDNRSIIGFTVHKQGNQQVESIQFLITPAADFYLTVVRRTKRQQLHHPWCLNREIPLI